MASPPLPPDEERRLQRLYKLQLLDTQAEAVLDAFTELAAAISGQPIATIALVDRWREWWKSAVGVQQGDGLPRELSFCAHAIASPQPLFEVEDARLDPRFADNPLVRGELRVIHYASAPLEMPQGERIGTLAVAGHEPKRLDERARGLLLALSRAVVHVLLLRERQQQASEALHEQDALRDSESRFRTLADSMPQMVWSARPDGSVDFYNRRWYDYVGAAPGSGLGDEWKVPVHPDDRREVAQQWLQSIASGSPLELQCRLLHHGGDYRWVLVRALPVRDDAGAIVRWVGSCTDVDRQKQLENQLREADRRKDDFLAMLAHELRSPLAPIVTAAHTLALQPGDPARVRDNAELIGRQVRHMASLLNDLMDVSRVTRGTIELDRQPVDLKLVVHDALEQVWPAIEERQHKVSLHLAPGPVLVQGDRTRLVQVVANLLNNAARYTPPGGLISVLLEPEAPMARIDVIDNGAGISAELLPHVFELFTQGRRTADRTEGGLGLGLALVRSLVELHGGKVAAFSDGPGQGSRFCVQLPLAQGAEPAGAAEQAPSRPARRSLRIMVVDDNRDAARSLANWLEAQGHEVVVEPDAAGALSRNQQQPCEVYVLDIGLPGMDGYELARRLREQPGSRAAVMVALTGYGQASDVERARAAGFDHHVVKPLDPQRMAQLLEQVEQVG